MWKSGSRPRYSATMVNVGLATSPRGTPRPPARPRTNAGFPAPRSPTRPRTSPGTAALPRCAAIASVSSGNLVTTAMQCAITYGSHTDQIRVKSGRASRPMPSTRRHAASWRARMRNYLGIDDAVPAKRPSGWRTGLSTTPLMLLTDRRPLTPLIVRSCDRRRDTSLWAHCRRHAEFMQVIDSVRALTELVVDEDRIDGGVETWRPDGRFHDVAHQRNLRIGDALAILVGRDAESERLSHPQVQRSELVIDRDQRDSPHPVFHLVTTRRPLQIGRSRASCRKTAPAAPRGTRGAENARSRGTHAPHVKKSRNSCSANVGRPWNGPSHRVAAMT